MFRELASVVLICIGILFFTFLLPMLFVDRCTTDLAIAAAGWAQNPTIETQRAYAEAKAKANRGRDILRVAWLVGAAGLGFGSHRFLRNQSKAEKKGQSFDWPL